MWPSISPSLSSKQEGVGKRGVEELRHGGEGGTSLLGEQTPASSMKSSFFSLLRPFFLPRRRSHWEPSRLGTIFLSYRLMVAAQRQKQPRLVSFFNLSILTSDLFNSTLDKNSEGIEKNDSLEPRWAHCCSSTRALIRTTVLAPAYKHGRYTSLPAPCLTQFTPIIVF